MQRPIILTTLFISLLMLLLPPMTVSAQQQLNQRQDIQISPAKMQYQLNPGAGEMFGLSVLNNTENDRLFKIEVLPFSALGEDGLLQFGLDADTPVNDWLDIIPRTFELAAWQHTDIIFGLQVPADTEAGGYYAIVSVSDVAQTEFNQAIGRIGMLLMIDVLGSGDSQAQILEFYPRAQINLGSPVELITRITNTGKYTVLPLGVINVNPTTALEQFSSSLEFNTEQSLVLAEATRKYTHDWEPTNWWSAGIYSADLAIVYGENNQVLTATTWFIYFPWQLIVLIVILILVLLLARRINHRMHKPKSHRP